jgi:hypothetical protein
MRIELKDHDGKPRLTVHVDPASPPTVVQATDGRGPAVSLDWDQTLDDEGHLRHCPVCDCHELYVRKRVPQLTVFALIVAAGVLSSVIYGLGATRPAVIVLAVVLGFDLLIWLYAPRMLACYRCNTEFHETPIPPKVRPWNAATSARYAREQPTAGGAGPRVAAAAKLDDNPPFEG